MHTCSHQAPPERDERNAADPSEQLGGTTAKSPEVADPTSPRNSAQSHTALLAHANAYRMTRAFASWRGTHSWGTRFLAWNTCLGHSPPDVERMPGALAPWRGTHAWGMCFLAWKHVSAFASWRGPHVWSTRSLAWNTCLGTHAWGVRFLAWNTCLGHLLPGVEHVPGTFGCWRETPAWGIRFLAWNTCLGHSLPGVEHMPGACAS